ncbi:MAG: hypothetical protein RSE93_02190 [Oscillospiraceae bacterium]
MELFMPTKIQKDNVYGNGFGKSEMKRTVITIFVGLAIGVLLGVFIFNSNFQTILLSIVFSGVVFGAIGYYSNLKNSINLSFHHFIVLIFNFLKGQKHYKYIKMEEWI